MDKDQNDVNSQNGENTPKRLTKATQAIFLVTVCILSFVGAVGVLGVLGTLIILVTAAMNVLLLLEFGSSKPKLLLLLFINILPFAAAYLYTSSLTVSLVALYGFVIALPIALTVRMGLGRSASIALAATLAFVLVGASFAITVANEYGALNAETIGDYLDGLFEPAAQSLAELTYEKNGEDVPYFAPNMIEDLLYYTKTLLIGTIASMLIVLAYFATLATRLLAGVFGVQSMLPMGLRVSVKAIMGKDGPTVDISQETVQWRIEIDGVTVGVYIAAYIATVLLAPMDGRVTTAYIALQNLVLILSPGFLYCGLRDIVLGMRGKARVGAFSRALPILGIIMIFINPQVVMILLCMLGVIVTIRENRARRHITKNRKE
ncbi:MAG: hypothetical protein IJF48_02960 [Clostridia bacterium]|nr:hypothetical protein [Clostridia bacterium]